MPDPNKQSKAELAKRASNYLRGTITQTLASDAPCFGHDDELILKFHGIYQQEDRDAREASKAIGGDKEHIFMVRARIPGGVLTADQYLALDTLADRVTSNRSLRITTRQGLQFHGVLKDNLRPTLAEINRVMLSTLAACGDVCRNVMACPAPLLGKRYQALRELAACIAQEVAPKTRAYHEIWLDGRRVADTEPVEPLYGQAYLPRKFKVGIALPEDNSIDVCSQCLGLLAVVERDEIQGFDVLVGGGFGLTHRKVETFARLATPLGYVEARHAVELVKIVAEMFRDHGDRADRRHARLKYVVHEWGIDKFREEFRRRASFELKPWVELGPLGFNDYLGPHPQGEGQSFYGLFIENGRLIDTAVSRTKTAIRKIIQTLKPGVILTPNQNILFTDLAEGDLTKIGAVLAAYNVPRLPQISAARRYSMACPALPTCGLALAESERELPGVIDELENELVRLGLQDEPITVRMTGCPNGCARPYTADISFVGRKPDIYDINVGGRLAGDRLVDLYAENVPRAELVMSLRPLLEAWARQRRPQEGLGDFYQRVYGTGQPKTILSGAKDNPARPRVENQAAPS